MDNRIKNRNWQTTGPEDLFSMGELENTPLGILSRRARYDLVRTGRLPSIVVGHRRYVTRRAIQNFLADD